MPAQTANAILLEYRLQGTQQTGNALLLSYDSPLASTKTSVRGNTVGVWAKADQATVDLFAPMPITGRENAATRTGWGTQLDVDAGAAAPWGVITKVDTGTAAEWGMYDALLSVDQHARWVKAVATDDQRRALWSAFGEALAEDRTSKWRTAKPTDARERVVWIQPRSQVFWPIPYVYPPVGAANFSVAGGGVYARFGATNYVPPIGNAINCTFDDQPYRAPYMRAPGVVDFAVNSSAANFLYAPELSPAVDQAGRAITEAAQRDPYRHVVWGETKKRDVGGAYPWLKFSRPLNPGWGIPTEPGDTGPQPGQTITVPVQRVYIVLNEIQLLRVSTVTPIVALTMNISFDCDSWLPQFTATIPESARDAIMPDPSPVEVEAIINGVQFRFFIERIQRNRQFGQNTISIAGRGIACELDAPYATASQWTNSTAMTAQQIIGGTLTATGYTQTWNITDWLVPANTFSQYGTPAQVAASVAEASGSVLQADWMLRDLRMLPRYPVKPWEWAAATPEYVIPGAVAQTDSIEWFEKPSYNVVYVSGVQNGVLGQVKITGTAGDLPAPMFTHPLITHLDAARQKGISVLGDTGRKSLMQISLPILPSTGVIDVCRLVEFNDGSTARRGIVRANNISVNWPTVRQTLTIEATA